MDKYYTDEIDVQVVIACLKKHGIRRVIVSPGSTNHTFVFSIQNDRFFQIWSCVDERSAAYMACGMAQESGEAVVLSCTGATASRNYFPALTEAYYRKLPILALTSTRTQCQAGNLIDQQLDRSVQPKDTVKMSVQLPWVKDKEDFWDCELKVNKAILELNHHGKGPVHINMPTRYDGGYDCRTLPDVRCIKRFCIGDKLPELPKGKKIGVFIGAHEAMDGALVNAIDRFCEANNAAVFCEHTSGYYGKYGVYFYHALYQQQSSFRRYLPDLVIDMGEIASLSRIRGSCSWRVSEDGLLKDPFKNLQYVFEMPEQMFFDAYALEGKKDLSYFTELNEHMSKVQSAPLELPFSNIYAASRLHNLLPADSVIHFGILNSLRSWSFFELPKEVRRAANVGGYGIDGGVSSLIGASLVNPDKLYFGVFGDLCFFYDMNALGNRHIMANLRIMLINNGLGEEFKLFTCNNTYLRADEADKYVAAAGHFGNKSPRLVKHYAEDLGFEYLCAANKEEFEKAANRFAEPSITEKPMLFEVFTADEDERAALEAVLNRYEDIEGKSAFIIKKALGRKGVELVKGLLTNRGRQI